MPDRPVSALMADWIARAILGGSASLAAARQVCDRAAGRDPVLWSQVRARIETLARATARIRSKAVTGGRLS